MAVKVSLVFAVQYEKYRYDSPNRDGNTTDATAPRSEVPPANRLIGCIVPAICCGTTPPPSCKKNKSLSRQNEI